MRLVSGSGPMVEPGIAGYQLPLLQPSETQVWDWDAYDGNRVDLRVGPSAECGPPPIDPMKGPGWHELPLNVSVGYVLAASKDLRRELEAFPAR